MIWPSPTLGEVMITLSAFKDGEKMILGNLEKFLGKNFLEWKKISMSGKKISMSGKKFPLMEIFFHSWKFQMDNFIVINL